MLFTLGSYEVKVSRNRKSGSAIEKSNRTYDSRRAEEIFAIADQKMHNNLMVGRIF